LTLFALPICSSLPHATLPTPIISVTTIINLNGVAYTSLLSLRFHLQQASTLATANYPENFYTTIVANAPSFFSAVWGWVKGWFDEVTRSKIRICGRGKEDEEALRRLVGPKNLPKVYGGEMEWKFEDEPALDEDAMKVLGGVFPHGPCYWRDGKVVIPGDGHNGVREQRSTHD
jgi:hypothetical protein